MAASRRPRPRSNGGVKAIAVTGDTRSAALPNVPTFKEAGVAGVRSGELDRAAGAEGHAGRHRDAAAKGDRCAHLADPKVREMYVTQGVEPSQTQDVRAFLARERDAFGRVVRELGITMD